MIFKHLRESRWVFVLLATMLAVLFWLYVRAELDPVQRSYIYNVPVEITGSNVLANQGLTVSQLSAETVTLRVEAATSVISSLSRWNVSVTMDVSKCSTAGDYTLSYTPNWPTNINTEGLVIVDYLPQAITVTVEKLYSTSFDIEFMLRGSIAEGYQAGMASITPETVTVSGAVDQVSQVSKVVALLERQELSQRFSGDLPLRLLGAAGEELLDLEVALSVPSAYVVLPVVVEKEIPITVNFLPGGGATQDDIQYTITPRTLTVSGSDRDIQALTELSLGSVDLSKVVGSNVFTFPISLDSSLENVSGITSASVEVIVSGLSTRAIDVDNIVLNNKPSGYNVISSTQVRTVVVRGKESELASIDESQIRIVADMSEITTVGSYSVPVKVYLDANSSVGVIGEYSIVVNITQ